MEHIKLKDLDPDELLGLEVSCSSFYLSYNKVKAFQDQHRYLMQYFKRTYLNEVWVVITACTHSMKEKNNSCKISLNKSHYTDLRSQGFNISYTKIRYVLIELEKRGYTSLFIGDRHGHEDKRRSSILRFNSKLQILFDMNTVNKKVKGVLTENLVEVRDPVTKEPIVGVRFSGIKSLRGEVEAYNRLLQETDITLLNHTCGVNYKRIFIGDLHSSGRYYGGSFQTVKSKYREHILLDGEETVELDISSTHPMIIACKEGIVLPENHKPYECYVGLQGDPVQLRCLFKQALMCMLYSSTTREAKASLFKHYCKEGESTYSSFKLEKGLINEVFDRVLKHNPYLKDYINKKDSWRELQYLDSSICRIVVNRFVSLRKAILLWHDSWVVAESDTDLLIRTIRGAWSEVLGTEDNLVIK